MKLLKVFYITLIVVALLVSDVHPSLLARLISTTKGLGRKLDNTWSRLTNKAASLGNKIQNKAGKWKYRAKNLITENGNEVKDVPLGLVKKTKSWIKKARGKVTIGKVVDMGRKGVKFVKRAKNGIIKLFNAIKDRRQHGRYST